MNGRPSPRSIGRYRIDGILGEGAMAVVYAGFDPGIDRPVAIKCLHRTMAADPGSRDRFVLEARATGHLVHPNIVTIFDSGETEDGRKYIAMERLSGETLDFFDFVLDPDLPKRTDGFIVFGSDNDDGGVLDSIRLLRDTVKNLDYREFPGKGHFVLSDLPDGTFPELLDALTADSSQGR